MKKLYKAAFIAVLIIVFNIVPAFAAVSDGRIKEGIYAGSINLSGLTADEARSEISDYVNSLKSSALTLAAPNDNFVTVTLGELGLSWTNEDIADEAAALGTKGNIIRRYKDLTDLKRKNKVFDIELDLDDSMVKQVLNDRCSVYNVDADNATLERGENGFKVIGGTDGVKINIDASAKLIENFISTDYEGEGGEIALVTEVMKPKGDPATLSLIKDRLGTFTTKYTSSGADRCANVQNGCRLVNGRVLYPGEQLSIYETVSPFTEENGYKLAGSYQNGLVVESLGGGICQVSTTLYEAVLRAELQVDERYNHSMVVNYVDHSMDAAISGTSKDFKFTNNSEYPVYIEGITPGDKTITFNIYGVETRPSNRKLEFESVDISETEPEGEKIVTDSSQPAGFTKVQSAHIGYSSELWKTVYVDGKETDRVRINTSHYSPSPRTLTLGTATDNDVTRAALSSAISSGSIDYALGVAASIKQDGGATALAQQAMVNAASAAENNESNAQGESEEQEERASESEEAGDSESEEGDG